MLEPAVVGVPDEHGLVKPEAFVVVESGVFEPARALESQARTMLAPFKCPRWFAFLDDLAKTAGKIQRFKRRETAALPGRTTQSAPA
jgi:acyl-coenzyme A synthetase/AMP-(fatty) acid ligase